MADVLGGRLSRDEGRRRMNGGRREVFLNARMLAVYSHSHSPKAPQESISTGPQTITTSKAGVVVHGISLRKDLGKVRKWLEAGNKTLGKTVGIRWLRRKTELLAEGKKTSSVVVYLEEEKEIDRVRLGGRLLRTTQYEPDRRRK
ncbi:hypothetical protein BDZ91DRAFT_801585 [Kalaharituber pfeilii]|nr:hypothetical protein BDZ91DRAFT_801585 [Kalaharituber pfeilii]